MDRIKKKKLVANISRTQYELVKCVLKSLNFELINDNNFGKCDLIWTDTPFTTDQIANLKPYQRINHLPSLIEISRKDLLNKNFQRISTEFPIDYDFVPRTWCVPDGLSKLRQYLKDPLLIDQAYIFKPASGSSGHGIKVCKGSDPLFKSTNSDVRLGNYVIQEYIGNPLLIDGYKCDLRVYVLITNCNPLRIFIYDDGIVRLSAERYIHPCTEGGKSLFKHLTNSSMNKRHSNYQQTNEMEDLGNKRSFKFLDEFLKGVEANPREVWSRIKQIIVLTILMIHPRVCHTYNSFRRDRANLRRISTLSSLVADADFVKKFSRNHSKLMQDSVAFEILGFDILLDDKFNPWLIEVNRSPSLNRAQNIDKRIKSALVRDAIRLLDINRFLKYKTDLVIKRLSLHRFNSYLDPKTKSSDKINPKSKGLTEQELQKKQISIKKSYIDKYSTLMSMRHLNDLEFFENRNRGNWKRIFPCADNHQQMKYLEILERCNEIFRESSCRNTDNLTFLQGRESEDDLLHDLKDLEEMAGKYLNEIEYRQIQLLNENLADSELHFTEASDDTCEETNFLFSDNEFSSSSEDEIPKDYEIEKTQELHIHEDSSYSSTKSIIEQLGANGESRDQRESRKLINSLPRQRVENEKSFTVKSKKMGNASILTRETWVSSALANKPNFVEACSIENSKGQPISIKNSIPLLTVDPNKAKNDGIQYTMPKEYAEWLDIPDYLTILNQLLASLAKISMDINAKSKWKYECMIRQDSILTEGWHNKMRPFKIFWVSKMRSKCRTTLVDLIEQMFKKQLENVLLVKNVTETIKNMAILENLEKKQKESIDVRLIDGLRICRLVKKITMRMLKNHGTDLWAFFESKKDPIYIAMGSMYDELFPSEIECLRHFVRICLESIISITIHASHDSEMNVNVPLPLALNRLADNALKQELLSNMPYQFRKYQKMESARSMSSIWKFS